MAIYFNALRQRHPFSRRDDRFRPFVDAVTDVDTATLSKGSRTLKLGHSQDAQARAACFNALRSSDEAQWLLHSDQRIGTVEQAIEVEAQLGEILSSHRVEPNTNENFLELDPIDVLTTLATLRPSSGLPSSAAPNVLPVSGSAHPTRSAPGSGQRP